LFRLIYLLEGTPPSWMAYVQFAVMVALMGLTYLHVTKRRIGFMPMFGVMTLIFLVDFVAYLPFLAYILWRDRRQAVAGAE
jgi:hypothetical protein